MKNKKLLYIIAIFFIICIVLVTTIIIFRKNDYKTLKFGNTNIKSAEDIKEYILNISSYEAEITLEVTSNKNSNKYKLIQKYVAPNIFKQEVIEPNNIKGLITIYDGKNLEIKNNGLGVNKIYENYNYIYNNSLCLSDFIDCYKNDSNAMLKEEENMIIMHTKNSDNKYNCSRKLYIDRNTLKPIKMEIEEMNKKRLVYILYNEMKINSINKEDVLAFKLNIMEKDI